MPGLQSPHEENKEEKQSFILDLIHFFSEIFIFPLTLCITYYLLMKILTR